MTVLDTVRVKQSQPGRVGSKKCAPFPLKLLLASFPESLQEKQLQLTQFLLGPTLLVVCDLQRVHKKRVSVRELEGKCLTKSRESEVPKSSFCSNTLLQVVSLLQNKNTL